MPLQQVYVVREKSLIHRAVSFPSFARWRLRSCIVHYIPIRCAQATKGRGMATCVVMAHRHPCCPRPQYSPCYHQLPSRTPLYNGLTGASETGYNKTSASGDALRASHLALWFLRSLALLLLCLLFLRLKVVETLRHSVKTVPCKSARWVNQISCLFSYYPVVPSYRAKVGVGRGIAK